MPQDTPTLDDALTLTEPCFLMLDDIDPDAFLRDRTRMDEEAICELTLSIGVNGLRTPIEVVEMEDTWHKPWGLLSGRRRYEAMRRMGYTKTPCVVRRVASEQDALRMVVEENAVREDITPWETGRILCEAVDRQYFTSLDEAVRAMHPNASRQKKVRLRVLASAYADFCGWLKEPESYSERQLRRLAAAASAGHLDLMQAACGDLAPGSSARDQWTVLERICWEAEQPAPALKDAPNVRRRMEIRAPRKLVIRRERTREGWNLRFTGSQATGSLMKDVMEYVERWFGDGG